MTSSRFSALALAGLFTLVGCGEEAETGSDSLSNEGAGAATTQISCPKTAAALKPPADQNLAFKYHAVGTQIYDCKVGASGYAWTFREPKADLFNAQGTLVGIHFGGPTWQHVDGSAAVGAKVAEAPAATTNDIPWLLLQIKSHGDDVGKFSDVTYIQRLSTAGGVAPKTPCSAANDAETVEVPYTADYYFYRPGAAGAGSNQQCG